MFSTRAIAIIMVVLVHLGTSPHARAENSNVRNFTTGPKNQPDDYSEAGGRPITPDQAERVIFTDPKLKGYGQADLYREGVQTLSTAVLYTVNQIQAIRQARQDLKNEEAPRNAKLLDIIGSTFCGADSGDECAKRFLTLQEPILRKYREAIAKNQIAAGELQDGTGVTEANRIPVKRTALVDNPPLAKPGFQASTAPDENKKAPPKVKTLAAIRAEYSEHESEMLAGITDESLVAANTIEILSEEPKREEFVQIVKVPRDPEHPESGDLFLQKMKPNGQPELDEKAYKEAMNDWIRRKKITDRSFAAPNSKAPRTLTEWYADKARESAQIVKKKLDDGKMAKGKKFDSVVEKGERDIFLESQHTVVEETNKQLGIGPKRAPSARGVKATPTTKIANTVAGKPVDLGDLKDTKKQLAEEAEQVNTSVPNDKLIDVYYAPEEIDKLITPDFIPNSPTEAPDPTNGANSVAAPKRMKQNSDGSLVPDTSDPTKAPNPTGATQPKTP